MSLVDPKTENELIEALAGDLEKEAPVLQPLTDAAVPEEFRLEQGARLAVADLTAGLEPTQGSLFNDPIRDKRRKLQQVAMDIEAKFGEQRLTRATLVETKGETKGAGVFLPYRRH